MLGVAVALLIAVAGIAYTLRGGPVEGLPGRADVWAALLATVVLIATVLRATWRRSPRDEAASSTRTQVDAAADLLAARTLTTWSQQVVQRGIQAPAPVRVSWRWVKNRAPLPDGQTAPSSLPNDPAPLPSRTGKRLRTRQMLSAGVVTRLHNKVYARLRHGRLVLIGGPGAGKTSAMILLLMEALRYREGMAGRKKARVPVPVWLTMGSWDPGKKGLGLRRWVTTTIIRDHPYLLAKQFGPDAIPQLFDQGRIALFLDGLDEMPETLRAQALLRLADEAPGLRVVITSRPEEFRRTLDTGVHLPYTPVVELRPVTPQAAAGYLLEARIGTTRQAWQDVANHLLANSDGVLARTLNTPLTLSLARSAYKDRDPGGLLAFELADERALRDHLLDQVLVAAYPEPGERDFATFWLSWLAYMMNTSRSDPIRDLRWWYIPNWVPGLLSRFGGALLVGPTVWLVVAVVAALVAAVVVGVMVAVVSPSAEPPVGGFVAVVKVAFVVALVSAILAGAATGSWLAGREGFPRSVVFRRPTRQELFYGLGRGGQRGFGAALGVMFVGALATVRLTEELVWRAPLLAPLLVAGLAVGFAFWLAGALLLLLNDVWSRPIADSTDVTPNSIYRKDVQTQLISGLVIGITRTLTLWLAFGVIAWLVAARWILLGPRLASYTMFWLTGGLWVGVPAALAVLILFLLVCWLGVTLIVGVVSGLVAGLGKGPRHSCSSARLVFVCVGSGCASYLCLRLLLTDKSCDRPVLSINSGTRIFKTGLLSNMVSNIRPASRVIERHGARHIEQRDQDR